MPKLVLKILLLLPFVFWMASLNGKYVKLNAEPMTYDAEQYFDKGFKGTNSIMRIYGFRSYEMLEHLQPQHIYLIETWNDADREKLQFYPIYTQDCIISDKADGFERQYYLSIDPQLKKMKPGTDYTEHADLLLPRGFWEEGPSKADRYTLKLPENFISNHFRSVMADFILLPESKPDLPPFSIKLNRITYLHDDFVMICQDNFPQLTQKFSEYIDGFGESIDSDRIIGWALETEGIQVLDLRKNPMQRNILKPEKYRSYAIVIFSLLLLVALGMILLRNVRRWKQS